jgi:hypothetical protein
MWLLVSDNACPTAIVLVRERCSGLHRRKTFPQGLRVGCLPCAQHATYSIDSDNNIIVGLPPPREGWVTARSYCLEESLAGRVLQVRMVAFFYACAPRTGSQYLKELMNAEEAALQSGPCQSSASLNVSIMSCAFQAHELMGLFPLEIQAAQGSFAFSPST